MFFGMGPQPCQFATTAAPTSSSTTNIMLPVLAAERPGTWPLEFCLAAAARHSAQRERTALHLRHSGRTQLSHTLVPGRPWSGQSSYVTPALDHVSARRFAPTRGVQPHPVHAAEGEALVEPLAHHRVAHRLGHPEVQHQRAVLE